MKYVLIFISAVQIFFCSCKKDNPIKNTSLLVGQWNWALTYPAGNPASYQFYPFTPLNTGNKMVYTYTADFTFSQTRNDTLQLSGTYSTGHGTYLPTPGSNTFIFDSINYFVNGIKTKVDYYAIVHNDTLVFSDALRGIIGGASSTFVRK